ncbi:opsin, ultraviolet-sensitive-like isoform X2 [Cimex lectularius]|uniref:G-protein coupled receptors family 1 profile domain-containing protein n=1 Tax=Cimex lectularius TaxID=79782 RepID=A0A8I6RGF4_CIMLE|nr:opsin, ultraviolet-sensitive-like isoform X2 [Cimex lectularius]
MLIILWLFPVFFSRAETRRVFSKKEGLNRMSCFNGDLKIYREDNFTGQTEDFQTETPWIYESTTEIHNESIFDNVTELSVEEERYAKFIKIYPVGSWKSLGFLTEDFFNDINPHWFNYPPPSHRSHHIFAAIYAILAVIGLSGNALVIFMVLSFRPLRTPSNILIMNLALSDFLMMTKAPVFVYNSLYFGPALGSTGCQVYGFLGGLTGTASIMTLAAVALDRYYVIAYPLDPAHKITKLRALVWILMIWTYSSIFASLPLTIRGIRAWCVPFSVIVFSYAGIGRAVCLVGMKRQGQEKEIRKREIKLTLVVILVIAMWFVAWTPYAIVALLGIFGQKRFITPLVSMIPAVFCKTAACTNPFVYSLNHPRMRQELFKLLCPKRYVLQRSWRLARRSSSFNFTTSIGKERYSHNYVQNHNSQCYLNTIELKNFTNDSALSKV